MGTLNRFTTFHNSEVNDINKEILLIQRLYYQSSVPYNHYKENSNVKPISPLNINCIHYRERETTKAR